MKNEFKTYTLKGLKKLDNKNIKYKAIYNTIGGEKIGMQENNGKIVVYENNVYLANNEMSQTWDFVSYPRTATIEEIKKAETLKTLKGDFEGIYLIDDEDMLEDISFKI